MIVEDDLHDLGMYSYSNRKGHIDHPSKLHHWQLGLGIWYFSEILNLLNFFYPFERHLEKKAQLQQEINKLKELKVYHAKQKNLHPKASFRNIRIKNKQKIGIL